jgi:hypothetical protein
VIAVRMASYPGTPRQAVVVAIIDFRIMSRAQPYKRRSPTDTRARDIPAKQRTQAEIGWLGCAATRCTGKRGVHAVRDAPLQTSRGPVVDTWQLGLKHDTTGPRWKLRSDPLP